MGGDYKTDPHTTAATGTGSLRLSTHKVSAQCQHTNTMTVFFSCGTGSVQTENARTNQSVVPWVTAPIAFQGDMADRSEADWQTAGQTGDRWTNESSFWQVASRLQQRSGIKINKYKVTFSCRTVINFWTHLKCSSLPVWLASLASWVHTWRRYRESLVSLGFSCGGYLMPEGDRGCA